jgi:tetratricopeptide (TPR) repeat protein
MNKPLKAFITYAHKNKEAKDKLIECLIGMQREGLISIWHDNEIVAGDKWREAIFSTNLPNSNLLLYLVSASSLYSENCNRELGVALEENIRPILIILEDCEWEDYKVSNVQTVSTEGFRLGEWESQKLGDIQALPAGSKPLNEWNPRSRGWKSVAVGLRETIQTILSQAELALQQGNFLMTLRQIDKAIENYSRAIKLNPNYTDAYKNRGIAYREKGKYNRAITDFSTAIDLKPDDAEIYKSRGGAYGNKGNYECAIADSNKAIDLDPNYAAAYSNRSAAYGLKGDYECAIADGSKAIDLDPNCAAAYNNRGVAYRLKGDYERAITEFSKAIDFDSSYAGAYNNRGLIYRLKGDYERAIADCGKAIDLKPDYARAYNNRGLAYGLKDDYECAIVDFSKAIDLKPDYADAYNNRGLTYGLKDDYERMIADCSKAIDLKPDYADAYNNRGVAYGLKGDYERAIADGSKAIDLKPDFADAYHNRGVAYGQRGNFECAIEDYNRAIELKSDLARSYAGRGMVRLHLREWDKARTDLSIARDMGIDIVALFHNDYKNVEAYERANRVKLPEDIAAMLTQRRRSRFPKTEKFLSADGTPLESPEVLNLIAKLRNSGPPLSQYVQTRPAFGLRTGASGAFVVNGATRDLLIAEHPASAEVLKPFLHGRDIRRWRIERPVDKSRSIGDLWLIFSYRGIEIDRYPTLREYLEKYRSSLSKRTGKQKWYELPTAKRNAERFTQTKLICPNNYDHQTFAVDTEGFYCGDTCYMIPTEETWLCGLLNSRAVEWFYSQVSKQLSGDYLQARSRHIQDIPIPDLTSTQKSLIGKIVDYLIFLQGQPTTRGGDLAHARDAVMLGYFERIIDGLAYESYLHEELHQGEKQFFNPLLDERLPQLEEIRGDKMAALREIFERLYERTHPVRRNLFFLNSVKPIRIIEDRT